MIKKNRAWVVKDSGVHGRGLFAARDITKGEQIIEYVGEWIDNQEMEKREKENDKNGLTYIFEYDQNWSVDGVVKGNESKFVNHSCDPNISVVREKMKIFFVAKRDIKKGEELAYDYSFPKDSVLVPCNCGAKKCRKYLNER